MATYLPGVTDYIPHIQPFKPDFNFYQKAFESKEADYKAGYDKISNVYGTLLNSDMLREDNIETRDKFFNQIQNDIQRMSTVDLSLTENQNTAYKAFQPLIDDKHVAKDMVFTKKYRGQQNFAQYLKTCLEKECDGKYWDDGLKALNYQAEDFIEADKQDALSIASPTYTPYSSGFNKAMALAKDMGIEIQNVAHDSTGKFIVTTKNGQPIVGPLANYFVSALSDDPATMEVYKTKAYVQRKDYAAQYASQYGGDKLAAERAYLTAAPGSALSVMEAFASLTGKAIATQEQKKKIQDKKIKKEGVNPVAQKDFIDDWHNTQEQIAINSRAGEEYDSAISSIKRADTADLNNLRANVDKAMSTALMLEDMAGAASSYASLTKSESWTADPFSVAAVQHSYRTQENNQKFDHDVFLAKYRNDLKQGFIVEDSQWNATDTTPGGTGKQPIKETAQIYKQRFTEEAKTAVGQFNKLTFDYYDKLRNSNDPDDAKYGAEQLKNIFGNYMDDSFNLKDFKSNPAFDVEGSPDSWKSIYSRASAALKGDKHIMSESDQLSMSQFDHMNKVISRKLAAQDGITKRDMDYNKNSMTHLKHYGSSEYREEADLLFDKDGREKSKAQFIQDFKVKHLIPGDPLSATDPEEVYAELSEEFLDIYNKKLAPGYKPIIPGPGGGGRGQDAMKAKFDAARISLSDRAALLSLKDDIYREGAFVMTGPNQAGEEGKIYSVADNRAGAQQFFAAVLDAATRGGWDPKTEAGRKRPIFTLTHHGVGLNTPGMQAYTIGIDPFFADQLRGSKAKAGLAKNLFSDSDGTLIDRELTLYIPDKVAENAFSSRAKLSDYDIIIQTQGSYVIDDYKEGGGTIEIKRGDDGRLTGLPTLDKVRKDGTYISEVQQRIYPSDPLTNTASFIEGLELPLKQLRGDNMKDREDILKLLPKEKSPQALAQSNQQ